MARVIFSPLISAMSGLTADAVFASWKGRAYVRAHVIPANPKSAAQTLVRNSLAEAVAAWQLMNGTIKTAFGFGGACLNISGYNDWVGRNRAPIQAETGLFMPRRDTTAADPYILTPTVAVVGEEAPGKQRYSWTDPGQGATYYMAYIDYDATNNVILGQDPTSALLSAQALTLTGHTIGNKYFVGLAVHRTTDGQMVHCKTHAWTQTV